jgi:hypothetical protein
MAPIPPLALLGRKKRIACLGHSGREDVLAADINALAGQSAELLIQLSGILASKLVHAANPEKLKIAEHGWPYGNQNRVNDAAELA